MAEMTQDEAKVEWDKLQTQLGKRKERVEGCTEQVLAVLDKWYPNKSDDNCPSGMDLPKILARAIDHFNPDDVECYRQCLDWVIDQTIQPLLAKAEDHAKFIYAWLVFHGYDEGNKFEFNDLDNHAFVITTAPMRVFCLTDQNCNYVIMLSENTITTTFLVCRYWDRWEIADKYDEEEEQKFKDGGVPYMLTTADGWLKRYSDNYPKLRKYCPRRPDLQWFKRKDFTDLGYGDSRDGYHVFSYQTLDGKPFNTDKQTAYLLPSISNALFDIRVTREDMEESDRAKAQVP